MLVAAVGPLVARILVVGLLTGLAARGLLPVDVLGACRDALVVVAPFGS